MNYRGRCTGRIIEFFSCLRGNSFAYDCIYHGNGRITYRTDGGTLVATVGWRDNTDIPEIKLLGKFTECQEAFNKAVELQISYYGYWELVEDDEFEGTTGIYSVAHEGQFYKGDKIKPSRLTKQEERAKRKDRLFASMYCSDEPIGESRSVRKGLDMTPVKMVLPSWSPGDSEQAISRLRRNSVNKIKGDGDE